MFPYYFQIGTNCKSHGANICKKHQTCMDSCECPGYECLDCSEAAKIGYHCESFETDGLFIVYFAIIFMAYGRVA